MRCGGCGKDSYLLVDVIASEFPALRHLCPECVVEFDEKVRIPALMRKKAEDHKDGPLYEAPDTYWTEKNQKVPKWVEDVRASVKSKKAKKASTKSQ